MGYFMLGFLFIVLSIIMFITANLLKKRETHFQKNKIFTDGVVVSHKNESEPGYESPMVSIVADGKTKTILCQSRNVNRKILPRGTKVNLSYATRMRFGVEWYDARIGDEHFKPYSVLTIMKIFIALGIVSFIASIFFFLQI